ncbi:MAG TPA: hypothetical protein VF662_15700 [Allosphingosinicella sp.]
MKRWRVNALLLSGAGLLALAIPALSQQTQTPEPLLPPGFQEPPPPPAEENAAAPATPAPAPSSPQATPLPGLEAVENSALEDLQALEPPPPPIEIPDFARRPIDVVGAIGPAEWGLDEAAFGTANGRFLATLMRRMDAPLPSRWMSILLRRALLSRVAAPSYVHPVDWVAERAWLLLRMGEADAARMLVQSVDVDQFTPKMFTVAVQVALATSDPAALCPLVEPGRKTSDEPVWPLADAMCAALEGEPARASTLIQQARRRSRAQPIDVTLAEKVIGAGENTRRAVTIQWDEVDSLNSWRFGIATATGLDIPAKLMSGAGSHVRAWQARAPMLPLEQRVEAALTAASLGVFSNASLVEMYSLIGDNTDPSEFRDSVAGRLRAAYVSRDADARVRALRDLWDDGGDAEPRRYANLILTAGAAARVAPSPELQGDARKLIASMLSAGSDARAARWAGAVQGMDGREADDAWALLALGSPRVTVDSGRLGTFIGNDDSPNDIRSKMLVAALAGLGRLDGADDYASDLGIDLGRQNRWTRLLDRAAERGQQGSVVLLAAAGMQTPGWTGVPPEHLYRIVGALRRVGLEYEARMIAAEALARL